MISLCRSRLPYHGWVVADMIRLSLGRRFDAILAWDSFFHLDHDDQRGMFAVFGEHSSADALLMFNTGPEHGEAVGSYRGDPCIMRAWHLPNTSPWSTGSVLRLVTMPPMMCEWVA